MASCNRQMKKEKLTPPQLLVKRFDGLRELARQIGCTHSRVNNWVRRGRVPSWHFDELLELAKKKGVKLTVSELLNGGYY